MVDGILGLAKVLPTRARCQRRRPVQLVWFPVRGARAEKQTYLMITRLYATHEPLGGPDLGQHMQE